MKRRSFLQMIGASVAAPLMPHTALGSVTRAATLDRAAVHAAIYHAQSRAVFSVWGLAKAANMTPDQAAAVMEHLSQRGILGPLQGNTHGGRWASSKIMQSEMLAKARMMRAAQRIVGPAQSDSAGFHVDLTKLMAHLRTLAARVESQRPCAVAS